VELVRRSVEAAGKRDLDAHIGLLRTECRLGRVAYGIGTFEGQAAMRGFWEDWLSSYEDWELQTVEVQCLGNGVTFAVLDQRGRLVDSSGEIELRYAAVTEWRTARLRESRTTPTSTRPCYRRTPRAGAAVGDVGGKRGTCSQPRPRPAMKESLGNPGVSRGRRYEPAGAMRCATQESCGLLPGREVFRSAFFHVDPSA